MSEPQLVVVREHGDRAELLVNFGVFAGREATPAEIQRLGERLLRDLEPVEVVCEQRYAFGGEGEAAVYVIRIPVPAEPSIAAELQEAVASWAEECLDERRLLAP